MVNFNLFRFALVASCAALSCAAASADTLSMTVQASVTGTCKLSSVPLLDFGALNQVTAPIVLTSGTVTYRCTKGTAPTAFTLGGLAANPFAGVLTNTANTDNFAYSIAWVAPTAPGNGLGATSTAINVVLNGTIAASVYQNVSAGTYNQVVAILIAP